MSISSKMINGNSEISVNGIKILVSKEGVITIHPCSTNGTGFKNPQEVIIDKNGNINGDVQGNVIIQGDNVTLNISGDVMGNIQGTGSLRVNGDVMGNIQGIWNK